MFASILIAAGAAAPAPQLPDWMTGCWETHSRDKWTEECWSTPRGKMMIGYSRSGTGDRVTEWENLQIILEDETDDPAAVRLAFWASPQGANRTMFAWGASKAPGLTFYNVQNDYPQRIRYWREGKDLVAKIALQDGGKPRQWRYTRSKP